MSLLRSFAPFVFSAAAADSVVADLSSPIVVPAAATINTVFVVVHDDVIVLLRHCVTSTTQILPKC